MEHNTHAPWRVVQNWHGKLAVVDSRATSGRVCNLPQGKNGRGLAMGRLIAAAPDLLAALRDLRDRAAMVVNRSDFGAVTEARIWAGLYQSIQHATAAIAKAEGDT